MKRRFTFDDAQKGIKGTSIPVDLDDEGIRFFLNELGFSDSSTGQTDPALPPAGALSQEQGAPQE